MVKNLYTVVGKMEGSRKFLKRNLLRGPNVLSVPEAVPPPPIPVFSPGPLPKTKKGVRHTRGGPKGLGEVEVLKKINPKPSFQA